MDLTLKTVALFMILSGSTMTQLVQYYTLILDAITTSKQMDFIYFDFAKAFDRCDHGVIEHKLRKYGIAEGRSVSRSTDS